MVKLKKLSKAFAEAAFGQKPFHLIFFVTARCNARCQMCFYLDQIENSNANLHKELTTDEIRQIFQRLGPIPYVSLSGGEPFLRKDLPEITDAIANYCDPLSLSIPSNCSSPERMERLYDGICERYPNVQFEAHVSLDGVGDVHDGIRKIPGLFDKVLSALKRLKELRQKHKNLRTRIVATYSAFNARETEELIEYASSRLYFDRFILTWAHGNTPDEAKYGLDINEYHATLQKVEKLNSDRIHMQGANLRLARRVKAAKERMREKWDREKSLGQFCNAGKRIVVVSEQGEVYPCEQILYSLGNVRDNDYDVAATAASSLDGFHSKYPPNKCHCEWGCGQNVGIVTSPKLWLEAFRSPPSPG